MSQDKLVHQANQIANFFRAQPNPVAGTAEHIRKFWDPRMRKKMAEHIAAGGVGLSPLALEGATRACSAAPKAASAAR